LIDGLDLFSYCFVFVSSSCLLKVRETLAHSLHEVARLVGQQIAEKTLLTVFEAFVQGKKEEKKKKKKK
jgi:hypothetical protein